LEKSVVIVLGPERSLELIVVVKAPMINNYDLLSFIEITHVPDGIAPE
jgi:hypothetical protein